MHAACITFLVIGIILLVLVLLKLYFKLTTGWDRSPTCLMGKTVIVTGANTGIGFYTAQDFAKRGARVILACRDPVRAEEAKHKIIETTGNTNVVVRILDLSSLASVRKFAIETNAVEERLDILVNNAGAISSDHKLTSDGLNLTMQINYFGPYLLTLLLIGLLKRSTPSRIVNVASNAIVLATLNVNDLNGFPKGMFSKFTEYGNTKLCNVLFTVELAKRLKGSGIDVNSLHPGVINTELLRNVSPITRTYNKSIGKLYYKTPEEGAQTSIYVAVSKEINGISGEFFVDCKMRKIPRKWKDEELAKRLWEKTETLVMLMEEEKL